jgi:hypothetical protein
MSNMRVIVTLAIISTAVAVPFTELTNREYNLIGEQKLASGIDPADSPENQ